jgi:hypothetical protein
MSRRPQLEDERVSSSFRGDPLKDPTSAGDKADRGDYQENDEEDPGDIRRRPRDSAESEQRSDESDNQESNCPA